MNVEQVYLLAGFYEESMPGSYGRVYSGSDERLMNYNRFQVHGGMFVRSDSTTNNKNGQCGSLDSYPSSSSYSLVSCSALLERSFKEQLLSKYASNAYLSHKAMQIPYIFAAASELLVFCAVLFLFASTGSSFIFLVCIFVPIIMMLGLVAFAQ